MNGYYRIDCDRGEDEDSTVAEGILDRIIHNKYAIEVKGDISMRKRHAFSASEESEVVRDEQIPDYNPVSHTEI